MFEASGSSAQVRVGGHVGARLSHWRVIGDHFVIGPMSLTATAQIIDRDLFWTGMAPDHALFEVVMEHATVWTWAITAWSWDEACARLTLDPQRFTATRFF